MTENPSEAGSLTLPNLKGTIILKQPSTETQKKLTVHTGGTLTFLFGPLYLAYHGVWLHAVICLALDLASGLGGNLIYCFFSKKLILNRYLKQGYQVDAHYPDGKEPKPQK